MLFLIAYLLYLARYNVEINENKMPRTIKDLLDCSPHANKVSSQIKKKMKTIDSVLCLLALIIIVLAVVDVSNKNQTVILTTILYFFFYLLFD